MIDVSKCSHPSHFHTISLNPAKIKVFICVKSVLIILTFFLLSPLLLIKTALFRPLLLGKTRPDAFLAIRKTPLIH